MGHIVPSNFSFLFAFFFFFCLLSAVDKVEIEALQSVVTAVLSMICEVQQMKPRESQVRSRTYQTSIQRGT